MSPSKAKKREGALQFHPVAEGICMEPRCISAGRFVPMIAGHTLQSDASYAVAKTGAVVCGKHKKAWEVEWDEALEPTLEAVAA